MLSDTFWFHLNVIVLRENVGGVIRVFLNGLWAQWWRDSTVWHHMQMVTERHMKQANWSHRTQKRMDKPTRYFVYLFEHCLVPVFGFFSVLKVTYENKYLRNSQLSACYTAILELLLYSKYLHLRTMSVRFNERVWCLPVQERWVGWEEESAGITAVSSSPCQGRDCPTLYQEQDFCPFLGLGLWQKRSVWQAPSQTNHR